MAALTQILPLLIIMIIPACKSISKADKVPLFIGTYTSEGSEGIYRAYFDTETGQLSECQLIAKMENPSFLVKSEENTIYAVNEIDKGKMSVLEKSGDRYDLKYSIETKGHSPCHISRNLDGSMISVANYSSGSITVYHMDNDQVDQISTFQHFGKGLDTVRQNSPHAHSSYFSKDRKYIYALDLGIDEIISYRIMDKGPQKGQTAMKLSPGDGPRHMKPHPIHPYWFVLNELSNTICSVKPSNDGQFELMERHAMLPSDFNASSKAADLHITKDGKYLYASNRGHDSIVIFKVFDNGKMVLQDHILEGIRNPRNFVLSPGDRFLIVANQDDDNLVVFKRLENGQLEPTRHTLTVSKPVCLIF